MMMLIADPDGNNLISKDEFIDCFQKLLDEEKER